MEKKYKIQKNPFVVPTTDGKLIQEHWGNSTGNSEISIAHMIAPPRSEERRVGKECLRLCRSRWSPYH